MSTLFSPFDKEIKPVILIPLLLISTLLFSSPDKEIPLLLILTLLFQLGKEISVLSTCLLEDKLIPSPLISTLLSPFDRLILVPSILTLLFFPSDKEIIPVILMPLVLTLTLLFFPSDKLIPLLPMSTLFSPFDR